MLTIAKHILRFPHRVFLACLAAVLVTALPALEGTMTERPMAYDPATPPHYGYLEYLPAGYASSTGAYPLVIFLHGIGERGNGTSDLDIVARNGLMKSIMARGLELPAVVIAPQAPPSGVGWFWHKYIAQLIGYCKTQYRIDPNRVYVTGLSAGGGTTWTIPEAWPGLTAAIVPICGASLPDPTLQGRALRRLPVWAHHNLDDTTVYPGKTRDWMNAIVKANTGLDRNVMDTFPGFPTGSGESTAFTAAYGANGWNWASGVVDRSPAYPMYTLYALGGHNSWNKTYENPKLWDWLFRQRNTAPSISAIGDRTLATGGNTGAIAFSVDDPQLHPDYLKVTAASSNSALVPKGNIIVAGSGAARTVTAYAVPGVTGSAIITLTVSDSLLTGSESFTVTVGSGNTAPSVSAIADQGIAPDDQAGPLAFTVGDAQTPAASLQVSASCSNTSLVPTSGIILTGTGTTRTVTVKPGYGKIGKADITLAVSDGALTTAKTFTVTVDPFASGAPIHVAINFQPEAAPVPLGSLGDFGKTYAQRGNGYSYGWSVDAQDATRDRNSADAPDQRHDTLINFPAAKPGEKWEIAVPNGSYDVRLVCGDPSFASGRYQFMLEGITVIDGSPTSASRWLDSTYAITVADGKLTLTEGIVSQLGRVCFIEIATRVAGNG